MTLTTNMTENDFPQPKIHRLFNKTDQGIGDNNFTVKICKLLPIYQLP